MSETTNPEVRALLRTFMEQHGQPVDFDNRYDDHTPNFYGWNDWRTQEHIHEDNCRWIIEPGATLTEHTYQQFTDTFHDADNEIGINATPAHCACHRYTNMHLRYAGSLGSVLTIILKDDDSPITL